MRTRGARTPRPRRARRNDAGTPSPARSPRSACPGPRGTATPPGRRACATPPPGRRSGGRAAARSLPVGPPARPSAGCSRGPARSGPAPPAPAVPRHPASRAAGCAPAW